MKPWILLGAACCALATALPGQSGHTLRTRWAASVTPTHALPDYPRPQMVRPAWTNLNGEWDYAIANANDAQPVSWQGKILVPFPVESQLSGVQKAVTPSERLWYRRTFSRPTAPRDNRILLHFGAVDWDATVWVNGKEVGSHRGGYDPFTFDITDALTKGPQELVVAVRDPSDSGQQPRGKQVLKPEGIWYTAVTGIWQTVWLEPVPAAHINDIIITPDIDAGTVRVHIDGTRLTTADRIVVRAKSGDKWIATAHAPFGYDVTLHLPRPHLWSPDDPFLYQLEISQRGRDVLEDQVISYVGMRKISLGHDAAGVTRLFLNNKPLFQYGMLDQGWWPDGLYTPPSDDAMRFDISTMKRLGFNMIRKHVKVEPARWYRLADSIGMLVWQDMPSGDNKTAAAQTEFAVELRHEIDGLRNHPAIVMWVPFNEGWGQHETEKTVAWLKAYDPTRLVNNASGWTDKHVGDVSDVHSYPGPAMPVLEPNRAAVLGEFGGLGLPLDGHTWVNRNNWGYRSYADTVALGEAYRDLMHQLKFLIGDGLSAAVYTQTTDVEVEVNGLMTYDREVVKLPASAIASAKALFGPPPTIRTVMPTSLDVAQSWQFTTTSPADGWFQPSFDDRGWDQGIGGFGSKGTPGGVVRTPWTSSDIWLRRSFELTSAALVDPHWRIHHDEDADIYLNGELVAHFSGYSSGYLRIPLDARARSALRVGKNIIAIHVHQTTGGQYIDLGLDEVISQ